MYLPVAYLRDAMIGKRFIETWEYQEIAGAAVEVCPRPESKELPVSGHVSTVCENESDSVGLIFTSKCLHYGSAKCCWCVLESW